jgi:hypothetical protein
MLLRPRVGGNGESARTVRVDDPGEREANAVLHTPVAT